MSTKKTPPNQFIKPIFILVVIYIIGISSLWLDHKGTFLKTQTIDAGIVSDKFAQDYACGKHKRKTCTDYYLVINNKDFLVSSTFFHDTHLKSYQVMKRTYSDTPWYITLFIVLILPSFLLLIVCVSCAMAHEHYYGDKNEL